MRDAQRIPVFCNELANIWKTQCPDWRFSQLLINVIRSNNINEVRAFYMEDEEIMQLIREFFTENQ